MEHVFIGASPRSGTTMLGSMLAASPEAFTTPESQFKFSLLQREFVSYIEAVDWLNTKFSYRLWNLNLNHLKGNVQKVSGKIILGRILEEYRLRNNCSKNEKVWIDHTPVNIEYIPQLLNKYPNAKILYLIRDGRAVMDSFFNLPWGPNIAYSAANRWLNANSFGLAASRKFKERIKIVHFERLVLSPESELKKICDFLKVTYDKKMIAGKSDFLPTYTKKQHSKVGIKPDPRTVHKWKKNLRAKDIYIFEKQAGSVLEMLGYELLGLDVKIKKGDIFFAELYSIGWRLFYSSWKNKLRKLKFS